MSHTDRSGRIEYPNEGFALAWNEQGLRVEVADYHAGVPELPWSAVFSIAKFAGQEIGAAPARER